MFHLFISTVLLIFASLLFIFIFLFYSFYFEDSTSFTNSSQHVLYAQIIRIIVLPVNQPPVLTLPQDSGGKSFFDVHEGKKLLLQTIEF